MERHPTLSLLLFYAMNITHLRANHHTEPIGYDLSDLSLSWIPESDTAQRARWSRIEIATDAAFKTLVADSGEAQLDSLSWQPDLALQPRTRYYWRVSVCADNGETASATSFFETGKCGEAWAAKWITAPDAEQTGHFIVRKRFTATAGQVARLHCTAGGIYEAQLNGKSVTDEVMLPGYHFYPGEIQSQSFDLTPLLQAGENTLEIHVGRGWYGSKMAGWNDDVIPYGTTPVIIAEVTLDGALALSTDTSWTVFPSPVTNSSIYMGEHADGARAALSAPDAVGQPAVIYTGEMGPIADRYNPPIRRTQTLAPAKIFTAPNGETVIDFGQNMTGWPEICNRVPAGTTWMVEAGEMLDENGNFFRENLRKADAQFRYTSAGEDGQWIRPHFTYFGFRYLRLTGWVGEVNPNDFRAQVIHSDLGITGDIKTGNALLDRFFLNTLWGQRGNFLDVPTDCPQRDERLGWTGDAQAFCATACFNMYTPAFFGKYIHDLDLVQPHFKGGVPWVIPPPAQWYRNGRCHSSTAWGDAATVIPWLVYTFYGDKSLLRKMYPAMKQWVGFIEEQDANSGGRHLWTTGFHFGDWLALDNFRNPLDAIGATDVYYIASAYYAYSTELTLRAAEVLGEFGDAERYRARLSDIKTAIRNEFFAPNGRCVTDTQTAYVVALAMDLVPAEMRSTCAARLAQKIRDNKTALETGFVGTYFLCRVLSDNGYADVAYDLLLREEYPSWLYEVKYGATTVWERWNSCGPASRKEFLGMNSLNHYAYGSIEEWVYRCVCGLNPDPARPGFRHVILRPLASQKLGHAELRYDSPCGRYETGWKYGEDGRVTYTFRIPFGCTATLAIPGAEGLPAELGPGSHTFTV